MRTCSAQLPSPGSRVVPYLCPEQLACGPAASASCFCTAASMLSWPCEKPSQPFTFLEPLAFGAALPAAFPLAAAFPLPSFAFLGAGSSSSSSSPSSAALIRSPPQRAREADVSPTPVALAMTVKNLMTHHWPPPFCCPHEGASSAAWPAHDSSWRGDHRRICRDQPHDQRCS